MGHTWASEPGVKDLAKETGRRHRICALYLRQMGLCYFCGDGMTMKLGRENTATVEHLKARYHGGKSNHDNLAASCKCCNSDKATLSAKEYFSRLGHDAAKRAQSIIAAAMVGMPLPHGAEDRVPAIARKYRQDSVTP